MKLVIDIPEILLDRIKSAKCVPDMYSSDIVNAVVCVRDGTPYEERPHGEWIEKEDFNQDIYYDCSVCGNSWCTLEGTPWQNGMNFCPNCGASMVKKEGWKRNE